LDQRSLFLGALASGFLLFGAANLNALDVRGEQSGTWRASDSPINLVGGVVVPQGATLMIEPMSLNR
jgi:hypothetical protein